MILTIYTPTYNRSFELHKLYESLCEQTNKDFIWLVVDDGSTDDTKYKVQQWIDEKKILVKYAYKENGGVHTARDLAYKLVESELIFGIDSDDVALPNMVDNILKTWKKYGNEDCCGIIAPVCSVEGKNLDSAFPCIDKVSYQSLTYQYHSVADHSIIVRSDIMKKIPDAPVFKNEKLVGEGFKWIQLPNKPFIIMQEMSLIHNYLDEGYSKNVRTLWFKNLNGFRAVYNQIMKSCVFFKPKVTVAIKYTIASFFLRDWKYLFKSSNVFLVALCSPIAFLIYLVLNVKWRVYR